MPSNNQSNHPKTAEFIVHGMSQECRGISYWGSVDNHAGLDASKLGKKVFIQNALPNERVQAVITREKKQLIEAVATQVVDNASEYRQTPACTHFFACGGCQLQYIESEAQLKFKQQAFRGYLEQTLAKNIQTNTVAPTWLPALTSNAKNYRRKVRLGVRCVDNQLIIGFRQPKTNQLIQIDDCTVLHSAINDRLQLIYTTLVSLSNLKSITHLEIAVGEDSTTNAETVTMLIRHMQAFTTDDLKRLITTFTPINWQLLSQSQKGVLPIQIDWLYAKTQKNNANINNLQKTEKLQNYPLTMTDLNGKKHQLSIDFSVQDFIQVNANVNEAMITQVLELLNLMPHATVLDLFSGVGNFSLPIAQLLNNTGLVIGVEGSEKMSQRASNNAKKNGLDNCVFFSQNLANHQAHRQIQKQFQRQTGKELPKIDAVVIDPPRAGAKEILASIKQLHIKTVVYISCNVATFVRDAIELTQQGYQLTHLGAMDMFPHTEHLEVMAKFNLLTAND